MEDHYARMDRAKEIGERDPFIGEGPHRLCVLSIEEYMSQDKGPVARVTLEVMQSQTHKPGTRVTKLYFITKPSKFPTQTNDADRFADFIKKLKGITDPNYQVGKDCRTLLRDRAPEQLARGMAIDAMGVQASKNPAKPFVEVYWTSVPQTPEEIRSNRQRQESTPGLIVQRGAPAAQPQHLAPPQPAPAAPQQGGFLAGVPGFGGSGGNNSSGGGTW